MSTPLSQNFQLLNKKFLDTRQQYRTIREMTSIDYDTIPEGFVAYCIETSKNYQYKDNNILDENLGKWRIFESFDIIESDDIKSLDAEKLTGTVPIERLPKGSLERCIIVANDTARFNLTKNDIQVGDTVKVGNDENAKMYFVVDDNKLDNELGYEVFTAGTATSVPWNGVTGKPQTYPPSSHTHDDRYYTESEVNTKLDTALNKKVDKIAGKGLSENDFTNTLKSKLDGIQSGAEVNVQSDWNTTDINSDSFIKHKPTFQDILKSETKSLSASFNGTVSKVSYPDNIVYVTTDKDLSSLFTEIDAVNWDGNPENRLVVINFDSSSVGFKYDQYLANYEESGTILEFHAVGSYTTQVSDFFKTEGGTLKGPINMNNNDITNINDLKAINIYENNRALSDKYLLKSTYTGNDILSKLKSFDGANSGLDADLLDGKQASAFASAAQGTKADNALPASSYTASDVLTKLKTVDGSGSGLDADLLDGKQASAFATSVQGTKADNALPASSYTASDVLTKLKTVDGSGSGLDADLLDGKQASAFATSVQGTKADNALPAASYTASDVLTKLKTVDGSGSGLDADLLDGKQLSEVQNYKNLTNKPNFQDILNNSPTIETVRINFTGTVEVAGTFASITTDYSISSNMNEGQTVYYNHNGIQSCIINSIINNEFMTYNNQDFIELASSGQPVDFWADVDKSVITKVSDFMMKADFKSEEFATAAQGTKADNALPASSYNARDILTKLKTVDGSGSGLDADLLDGKQASEFATAAQGTKADNALPVSSYTARDVLTKLKTVDGAGSGLDADLLDGYEINRFMIGEAGHGYMVSFKNGTSGLALEFKIDNTENLPVRKSLEANSLQGKQASDFIINYGIVNDVNTYSQQSNPCVIKWNSSTLNSPLKANITGAATGTIYVNTVNGNWCTMLAVPDGQNNVYIKSFHGSALVKDWEALRDAYSLEGKQASDFMLITGGVLTGALSVPKILIKDNQKLFIDYNNDGASIDKSNVRIGTWYGFAVAPTSDNSGGVPLGKNAFWVNARTGNTYTYGQFYANQGQNLVLNTGNKQAQGVPYYSATAPTSSLPAGHTVMIPE